MELEEVSQSLEAISQTPQTSPQGSRKSSTEEPEIQDRGIILDILKDPEALEVVENVAGCCVHFLRSSCCSAQKEEDSKPKKAHLA
jgi:hypothetical protein